MDIVVSKLAEDGASGEPLHANSGQEEGGFTVRRAPPREPHPRGLMRAQVMAETYGTYSFCFDDARRGALPCCGRRRGLTAPVQEGTTRS
jgi:hypothetical protein